jgi:Fic family protein
MVNTPELDRSPCGHLVPTVEGFKAFVPNPLPRELPLSSPLISALDKASLAVGTLAGVGETLQNPHLLITPFLRREAVLSSRIEGTQASISDVFIFEAGGERADAPDTREVVNYVHALNLGLERLNELPICVRLTNEVHARLMLGVRGEDKTPGQLREHQNWIGTRGTNIEDARFIPPPPELVSDLMADWERFVNEDLEMPALIQCALMHYQFEAIHPYLDGNGRIGRLLITLFLCAREVLPTPLLYLSAYFDKRRDDYINHLFRVSATGEWEPWITFFLRGVEQQARDALIRSRRVRELHQRYVQLLQSKRESANALRLLDILFANPYVTAPRASELLGVTHAGAQGILNRLVRAGVLEHISGRWPRLYVARELLRVIEVPIAA